VSPVSPSINAIIHGFEIVSALSSCPLNLSEEASLSLIPLVPCPLYYSQSVILFFCVEFIDDDEESSKNIDI
jgi:hypothetical protein